MIFLSLLGCVAAPVCTDCDPVLECSEVAILDATGARDVCDVSACEACIGSCGSDCAVRETSPPQYVCGTDQWDVYDACPAWHAPTTPYATEIGELGCGDAAQEELTATATVPHRIDVLHTDYIGGCCPESVRIDVTTAGTTLSVAYALLNDHCECYCELDVAYSLVEVPSGTWTVESASSGAAATVTVP